MRMKRLLPLLLALLLLAGCGQGAPAAPAPAVSEAPAEASKSRVAGAAEMTTVEEVLEEGMLPLYAESLKEGVYPVTMKSSSSMFKAERCALQVAGGRMEAVLYMSSDAYAWLYAGSAQQAAEADEADYIPLAEQPDGACSFTLPIEALDAPVSCAAFSVKKELWYDRTLLFRADSLPLEAFDEAMLTTPESLALEDGTYQVKVQLGGGSGKAAVESPTRLFVEDGVVTAEILWGSPHYDYMLVGGERYLPLNTGGNSRFVIPVPVFDRAMPVIADTTAMSQPYEIAYSLRFDSASIEALP